jgi:hypothetical protein
MGHGILMIALATAMLGVAVGGALYHREIATLYRGLANRLSPPPAPPAGPPIERIARDARRLRAELVAAEGTPMARRVAVSRAYDDLLVDACRALGIPDTLSSLPPGTEREAERLHVEHELTAAGVRLSA